MQIQIRFFLHNKRYKLLFDYCGPNAIQIITSFKSNMQHIMLIVFLALAPLTLSQHNPNFYPNRSGIVHLFEWKFNDIATECETYLSSHGFAGVQVKALKQY